VVNHGVKIVKSNESEEEERKKAAEPEVTYKIYIFKVLKQVHPDIGISSKAMGIMNSFINDIFETCSDLFFLVNWPSMLYLRVQKRMKGLKVV
jgi:hypothetical protein